jgi:hypothetical protein
MKFFLNGGNMKKVMIAVFLTITICLIADNKPLKENDIVNVINLKVDEGVTEYQLENGKEITISNKYSTEDDMYSGVPHFKFELNNEPSNVNISSSKNGNAQNYALKDDIKLPSEHFAIEHLNGKQFLYVFPITMSNDQVLYSNALKVELEYKKAARNLNTRDNFGHIVEETTFEQNEWIDVSHFTPLELTDESFSDAIDLPFEFPYFNNNFSNIYVGSNGLLSFSQISSPTYQNQRIPYLTNPNNIIAPFWDDLKPLGGNWGNVYAGSVDFNGEDVFVVMYNQVKHYYSFLPDHTETFEVILHEDGQIDFLYLDLFNPNSATVGIENENGTDGTEIVFNRPYLNDTKKITFKRQQDITPPQIVHTPLEDSQSIDNIVMTANISDDQMLANAKLHVSINGSDYNEMLMVSSGNNIYEYMFDNLNFGDSISYYLSAEDVSGNNSRFPDEENSSFTFIITLQSPQNLAFNVNGDNSVISWDSVEGAEQYELYYRLDQRDSWILIDSEITESNYDHDLTSIQWKNDRQVNVLYYRVIAKSIN